MALRARHLGEIAQWKARSAAMAENVSARARAEVQGQYGHRWALIWARRDDPELAAKVAALRQEEAAAIGARTADLMLMVNAQRTASRALLSDRQRRERAQLRARLKLGREAMPDPQAEVVIRAWTRVLFRLAARQATRRPGGIVLRFRRGRRARADRER